MLSKFNISSSPAKFKYAKLEINLFVNPYDNLN